MPVEAHFDKTVESVALARHFTEEVLGGVRIEVIFDIVLMVSELAANAVLHGATTFALSIERTDAFVRAEVADAGGGRVRVLSPSLEDSQGRGLQLVELLSDQWGTTDQDEGGKSVWFVRNVAVPWMTEPMSGSGT